MSSAGKPGLWRSLAEDVACVFQRDPAARSRVEVLTIYPGVQAIALYRCAHGLWNSGWPYGARLLSYLARCWTNIEIHPAARIGRRFFIDHGAGVVIGETTEIGDDCTLYHGVTLGGTSWNPGKRHPTLGNQVVVGAGAKVLGPISVADNARIGTNSVVVKNVPAGSTVVGIPGKVVKVGSRQAAAHGGIDLDHHLIPDPVAGAISCLIDRLRVLEARAGIQRLPNGHPAEQECDDCQSVQVCADDDDPARRVA